MAHAMNQSKHRPAAYQMVGDHVSIERMIRSKTFPTPMIWDALLLWALERHAAMAYWHLGDLQVTRGRLEGFREWSKLFRLIWKPARPDLFMRLDAEPAAPWSLEFRPRPWFQSPDDYEAEILDHVRAALRRRRPEEDTNWADTREKRTRSRVMHSADWFVLQHFVGMSLNEIADWSIQRDLPNEPKAIDKTIRSFKRKLGVAY